MGIERIDQDEWRRTNGGRSVVLVDLVVLIVGSCASYGDARIGGRRCRHGRAVDDVAE